MVQAKVIDVVKGIQTKGTTEDYQIASFVFR